MATNYSVTEIFFNPQQGRGQTVIGNFNNIVSVGGFYSNDDKFRHAIVAAQARGSSPSAALWSDESLAPGSLSGWVRRLTIIGLNDLRAVHN
jgi:hypothetical protein